MKKNYLIPLLIMVMYGCSATMPDKSPKPVNSNYVVLLDMSDRLLLPGQANRDIKLICSAFVQFELIVRQHLVVNSADGFRVVAAPQAGMPAETSYFEDQLILDLKNLKASEKIDALDKFRQNLKPRLSQLYKMACEGRCKNADFAGADIWRYFNEQLASDLDPDAHNQLLVFTDGYFDFESYDRKKQSGNLYSTSIFLSKLRGNKNWKKLIDSANYGIIPVEKQFAQLSVCVLEVNPKFDNLDEADMLQTIWAKWLASMNIRQTSLVLRGSLPKCKGLMVKFLETK